MHSLVFASSALNAWYAKHPLHLHVVAVSAAAFYMWILLLHFKDNVDVTCSLFCLAKTSTGDVFRLSSCIMGVSFDLLINVGHAG